MSALRASSTRVGRSAHSSDPGSAGTGAGREGIDVRRPPECRSSLTVMLRLLGISRRAPRTIEFARVKAASGLLLAHALADVAKAPELRCD
jgi:hypothetical protein